MMQSQTSHRMIYNVNNAWYYLTRGIYSEWAPFVKTIFMFVDVLKKSHPNYLNILCISSCMHKYDYKDQIMH